MFDVVSVNEQFVVVSKKPGVPFHRGDAPQGLVGSIRQQLNIDKLYPLHRLDTMTSGLLLFARTIESAREIAAQFRNKTITKFYIALSDSKPIKKQGLVVGDMVKGRRGVWILSRTHERPAITQFFSAGLGNGLRFFIIRPYTGRTHQIRVALKAISAPVLGDMVYQKKAKEGIEPDRGYLHSYAIGFTLNGQSYRFVNAPNSGRYFTDANFTEVLQRYREPWDLPWPRLPKFVGDGR